MQRSHPVFRLVAILALLAIACQPAPAAAPAKEAAPAAKGPSTPAAPAREATTSGEVTRVSVGITNALASQDPTDHSDTFLYQFWCEVLGCLFGWDPQTGDPVPELVESWETENPTTWIFNLRKNVKWHDGTPFTAADVVASLKRAETHATARQKYRLATVSGYEAVDDHTVRLTTTEPSAELLDAAFVVGLPILQKAQLDRGDDLSKVYAIGTGPYMLKEWIVQQRAVITKTPNWWGGPVEGPDEVVYRVMREDEVRVTALLNNEIQIAQELPPQQVERVNANSSTSVMPGGSITVMFLAMRTDTKPFDNKLVRQAVAHAIDRDAIIKSVLLGYAEKLEGPVGPGQYGYDPNLQPRYTYDPEKARQLMAQAGYANGVDVELNTPVGTYVKAKEVVEAMIPMLHAVGIRAEQLTPEGATLFTQIQEGKIPFFYFGRGSVRDAGQPLSQYFETGISNRVGYSNPRVDELFKQERAAFDPEERKKLLSEIQSQLLEDVPAHFLWRYKLLWGVSKSVEWTPRSDEGIYASQMRLK